MPKSFGDIPFTNLSDVTAPDMQMELLVPLLDNIISDFHQLQPKTFEMGLKDSIYIFDDWSTNRRNSIEKSLQSLSLVNNPTLRTQIEETSRAVLSGLFYYSPNGFMGWHTNFDNRSKDSRIYVTCNDRVGSKFLYRKQGTIYTMDEPLGWSIKYFDVSKPFWHAVISNANRYSFGFRFI